MNAVISPCGKYRYSLTREWIGGAGVVVFVMLNPSTADASQDDPTIRRCVGFAMAWGMAKLEVVNLYAWRATDPADLAVANPIGPENDAHIAAAVKRSNLVVAAWGAHAGRRRATDVVSLIEHHTPGHIHVLGLTKDGCPRHPLYVKASTQPYRWVHE